jgi:hypothetical protein
MEQPPDVIALYRAAPEDFIAGRDALAKGLRDAGSDGEARAVKALRKPTVVAWALNQLGDRDPSGVEALIGAGGELRAAQRAAVSGRGAERLRSATTARRKAVSDLTAVAAGVLTGAGRDPSAHVDEITSALEAAAVDDEAGATLRQGTFERPPRPESGFGDLAGLTLVPSEGVTTTSKAAKKSGPADLKELRRRRDAERKRADREHATADDLAAQITTAEGQLEKLRGRHVEAVERAKVADLDARRAERNLTRAEE